MHPTQRFIMLNLPNMSEIIIYVLTNTHVQMYVIEFNTNDSIWSELEAYLPNAACIFELMHVELTRHRFKF